MDPLAGMDDSSTDDDNTSQTTEDDPQVPEHDPPPPPAQPAPPPSSQQPSRVQRPNYQLQHTLIGHTKSISAVKFSPDGTLLASCGAENTVKIWSPFTGELVRNLTGHTEGLSDIAWSTDSVYLASASDDKTIRIWEVDTGVTQKTLKGHSKWVFCLNYNHNSTLLVSGACDGDIRIWDTKKGGVLIHTINRRCLKTLHAHIDYVTAVHFNRDSSLIVSCSLDGQIQIWNTTNGQCLKTIVEGHDAIWYVVSRCFFESPVDLTTSPRPRISAFLIAQTYSQHVQFSPNSKYILSTAHDSAIRLWDYQTTRCLKTYTGHVNKKYCICACFSVTGGKWIVAGSEDHKVWLWDLQTREVVQVLEGHSDVVVAVATHPSKNMIASGSIDSDLAIRIWEDRTGTERG
ncbi:hypothetical protein D9758_007594 [Tetrapyrgos nigripes]|uniref:WD40 repeat-like protein n=1 Tax=Tetrapyrgos nigripes TaxID=182062 RepID=A0A8H5G854_9AGAR|nr:hypothetical protein D9758_007594 [Tetrapyrgos nigripes]